MFSKHVKKLLSPASITGQLTLFYSVASFILLTVISLLLYWSVTRVLYSAEHQFLSDEIKILQSILLTKPDNSLALQQEVKDIPSSIQSSAYHYYIRVLDSHKKTIVQTPNIDRVLYKNNFFSTNNQTHFRKQYQWWQSNDGKHYLLASSVINSNLIGKFWIVQIAIDLSYQQTIINKFRILVLIIILSGATLSIGLSYLISRKAMRRLRDLTETTKKITVNALQQRIDPRSWPEELNELGLAYNQMLDRIECSISKLTQFSDDLAHELRTPINNLMGEAEVMLSRIGTPDEYQHLISSMLEELNRIHQIIENILFLARAENPQIELTKSPLNINNEINVMCQFYQALADEKNIMITCSGDGMLLANQIMFRRMIGNLLSNALKYSKCGSEIIITIKEIESHTSQIMIADNGIGMDSKHIPNIFRRFYRVDTARTQHSGSTGLGLAIVKSIVELHQGTISITSTINEGTTFLVTLPK